MRISPLYYPTLTLIATLALAGCYRHARRDAPTGAPSGVASDLVTIPAGTFTRGDRNGEPDEYPETQITLATFRLERTEVSNASYRACVQASVCDSTPHLDDLILGQDDHPVVGTSWEDAARYCAWIGRRMPSEAEWEHAARGPDLRKWPWRGTFAAGRANVAGHEDGSPQTAPVTAFAEGASAFGVLNMAGNIAEWVADYYDPTYYRTSVETRDPRGPPKGRERVVRGGSYADGAHEVRVSSRRARLATEVDATVGFRCAQDE